MNYFVPGAKLEESDITALVPISLPSARSIALQRAKGMT